MHWSLDQLRQLNEDEYAALIEWARERADRMSGEEGIDVDKLIEANKAKDDDAV